MKEVFVQPLNPIQQLQELQRRSSAKGGVGEGKFAELLKEAIHEVDHLQKVSDQQIEKVLSGEIKDVHSAMLAMQKADLSFQMMMQVRNKLVEAYQEIMRMQV